jgi:transposase-like protein
MSGSFFMSSHTTKSKRKRDGRRSKYNPEMQERIIKEIEGGLGKEQTAHLCGISPSTLYEWERKHPKFQEAIKEAESKFETNQLLIIREAAINRYDREGRLTRKGSWVASAWLLERKFHDRYGQRWQGELSGKGGKPLIPDTTPRVDTSKFTKEQLDKLIVATDILLKTPKSDDEPNGNGNGHTGV